jgi:hypothetical protein
MFSVDANTKHKQKKKEATKPEKPLSHSMKQSFLWN